jgi:hypothetical protein
MCALSSHRDGLAITGRRAKLAHPFYTSGSWPCRLPPSFPSPRALRVRRPAHTGKASSLPAAAVTPCHLPPDSLALSLLLAGRVIAEVRAGRSLTQALTGLSTAPGAARAGAQDVAYGTLRRYACGEFVLRRLLERALPHPEVEALLLGALYRLQTRPESPYMVVDQAVAAAGELAGGAFRVLGEWRAAQLLASARDSASSHCR